MCWLTFYLNINYTYSNSQLQEQFLINYSLVLELYTQHKYNQVSSDYKNFFKKSYTKFENVVITNKKCGDLCLDNYFGFQKSIKLNINNIHNYIYSAWVLKQINTTENTLRLLNQNYYNINYNVSRYLNSNNNLLYLN